MPAITKELVARLVASGVDSDLARLLAQHSRIAVLSKGDSLFREKDVCDSFMLVVSGSLKVQKITPDGHELVLYRIEAGEECNLTNACLLGGHRYPAEAVAETDSEILLVFKSSFFQLLEQHPQFRSMIFKNIEHGMNRLLDLVQEVAFEQMDHRLAAALLQRCHDGALIRTTHHALAADLGTAREVVSRLLKEFERNGWIKLRRGVIEIVNKSALAKF